MIKHNDTIYKIENDVVSRFVEFKESAALGTWRGSDVCPQFLRANGEPVWLLVTITLTKKRVVTHVMNNRVLPGYDKVGVTVGEVLPKDLIATMMMNPHRFKFQLE
jgi:hypothetical protein